MSSLPWWIAPSDKRLLDLSDWHNRLRWIWSRPVRQLDPPALWGDFTNQNRSAWTPNTDVQDELKELADTAISTGLYTLGEHPGNGRKSRRYTGLSFAAPTQDWTQPPNLADMEIVRGGRLQVLDGTPGANTETWIVGGGALFSPGDLYQTRRYIDDGCRIEQLLLRSAIDAGEAYGVTTAGASKAPWLNRNLRRDLTAAAHLERRHLMNVAPDRRSGRAQQCRGCARPPGANTPTACGASPERSAGRPANEYVTTSPQLGS